MRDDIRPGRPAPRPADRQPAPPAMLAAAPPGGALSPLDSADASFRALTTGPQPLALHAASLAPGLPDRLVPLDELRALLLHPATGARARNKVWAELVRRARSGSPAWVVGLVGVAMPGLRRAAATLAASYRGDAADLHTEILTGFLEAMRGLDPDDLDRVPLASRLCWTAWRAGQALACADARYTARRRDLPAARIRGDAMTSARSRPARRRPAARRPGRAPASRARAAARAAAATALAAAAQPALASTADRVLALASISQVIANITAWITGLLAGLATLFLTIGGLRYLMAGGDPGEVERAKTALRSAAIGYGLAILAPVIVTVLKSLVGG